MANELVIPPDLLPETGEQVTLVDDQTFTFRPQFGRAWMQRNSYGDPRWQFVRRYRGLRQKDRARLQAVLNEAQGAYRTIMVSPAQAPSGTWVSVCGGEVLANTEFSNTTGWSIAGTCTFAVNNGVLRSTSNANGQNQVLSSTVAGTVYAPYAGRSLVRFGPMPSDSSTTYATYFDDVSGTAVLEDFAVAVAGASRYAVGQLVPLTATLRCAPYLRTPGTVVAGDYFEVNFVSLARCMLADGGGNLLVHSDALGTAPWGVSSGSASSTNGNGSPDGSLTDQYLQELNTSNIEHYTTQGVTVPAALGEFTASVSAKAGVRNWLLLRIAEGIGSTYVYAWFNVATGVLGSTTTGANWASLRVNIAPQGGGWYRCSITAKKTNAATTLAIIVQAANSDGTSTYAGTTSAVAITMWRPSLNAGSVPTRGTLTTTVAVAASTQSGPGIYVKGLPASQTGLLVAGDWVEVDGQLKQLTSSLDSDASGLGYLQFRPKIARAVADNTPVIVTKPMGRFMLGDVAKWSAESGLYADSQVTLDEVYE